MRKFYTLIFISFILLAIVSAAPLYNSIKSGGTGSVVVNTGNVTMNQSFASLTGIDSNACGGTDKVTEVNFNNGVLSIVCDTDITSSGGTYNVTYDKFAYNQSLTATNYLNTTYGKFWYNMTTSGTSGTFNATYNNFSYNHTIEANKTIWTIYNSVWSSTYNITYASNLANNSWNETRADILYTPAIWAYNQTLASGWDKRANKVHSSSTTSEFILDLSSTYPIISSNNTNYYLGINSEVFVLNGKNIRAFATSGNKDLRFYHNNINGILETISSPVGTSGGILFKPNETNTLYLMPTGDTQISKNLLINHSMNITGNISFSNDNKIYYNGSCTIIKGATSQHEIC